VPVVTKSPPRFCRDEQGPFIVDYHGQRHYMSEDMAKQLGE
jgi:hypothetical protein